MGLFKSSVIWSSIKNRKVLRKRRGTVDETKSASTNGQTTGTSQDGDQAQKYGRSLSLPVHETQESIEADNTVSPSEAVEVPRYSIAETFAEDDEVDDEPAPAAITRPREPIEPMFPDIPSNITKPSQETREERIISSLPAELWGQIATFLDPLDAARLAHASKTLRYRLGSAPWKVLDAIENHVHKVAFLSSMDNHVPGHLFCFLCACYHTRSQPGREKLPVNHVANPVFICPNARKLALPRLRLTHGRELPFAYVQLATRAERHSPNHGIPVTSLARRWQCKDSEWSHSVRFHIHENGHLLMRCASTTHVKPRLQPVEERLLLYSRNDYAPYFSVCAHWANGNLMPLCKCALSHIPAPVEGVVDQLRKGPKIELKKLHTNIMPKMCDECKPLRRCTECPSEYLISLKLVEDKRDRAVPFKQAICVTRWSDLGNGTAPSTPEWAGITGQQEFDSLGAIKGASLCSIFEAAVSRGAPGQQMQWLSVARDTHQDVY